MQLDIFSELNDDRFTLKTDVALIEFFGGIGSQHKALKKAGFNIASSRLYEVDIDATISYAAIHCNLNKVLEENETLTEYYYLDELENYTFWKNEQPYDIKKFSQEKLKVLFYARRLSNNHTNIFDVDIEELDKYILDQKNNGADVVLTWSTPCFTKDTLVNTLDGFKKIKDIQIGDYVSTIDGSYQKVTDFGKKTTNERININSSNTHKIETTFNHPFYVLKDDVEQWVDAKDLTTKEYLISNINKRSETMFFENLPGTKTSLNLENIWFWYLCGRFLGDGWTRKNGSVIICCNDMELSYLEECIKKTEFNYCVTKERTINKIQISSRNLENFLNKYFGKGASTKFIHGDIVDLDKKYLTQFLKGYLDSDGCKVKDTYKITTTSEQLAYSIGQIIVKVMNVPYSIYKNNMPKKKVIEGRVVNQKDFYQVTFKLKNYNKNINFVKNGKLYSRVRKIESVAKQEIVYNMTVDKNNTYCVYNQIVHNCQEFSMAGNRGGFDTYKGSLTGVSLDIFNKLENKPNVLLFENVPGIKSGEFKDGFNGMLKQLRKIGYESNVLELNAKDFGVPQNRKRVFIVSVLKEDIRNKFIQFPKPKKLQKKLKDLLEDEVDQKYFLNQEQLDKLVYRTEEHAKKGNGFKLDLKEPTEHQANTITTQYRNSVTDNYILKKVGYYEKDMVDKRIYETDGIAATVVTNGSQNSNYLSSTENLKIQSDVKCGYEEANDGDGIYINRPHQKRGVVQKQMIQTIKTSVDVGVVIYKALTWNVRKLIPLECWRLMGFSDDDHNNASKHMTQTALYKQAGNSIVVDVLENIFKRMQ